MSIRTKLLSFVLVGFMIPPIVWIFIVYYSQIFTYDELFTLVLSLPMIAYIILATAAGMTFFNVQLTKIELAVKNGVSSQESDKTLASMPKLFMLVQVLYTAFGPLVVLSSLEFVSSTQFWLAQLLTVPLVLLFVIPVFISFVTQLEKWSKNLAISDKHPFISFSHKIIYVIFNTLLGNIFLLVLFNITLSITQPSLELSDLIFKNIVIALFSLNYIFYKHLSPY